MTANMAQVGTCVKGIIPKSFGKGFFSYTKEQQREALTLAYLADTNLDHINRYVESGRAEASLAYVLRVLSSEELNNHNCVINARLIH